MPWRFFCYAWARNLIRSFSLQLSQSGKHVRTCGKLHSPSNGPAYSSSWTNKAHGFPCQQRKTGGLAWPGYSVHTFAWERIQTMSHADHGSCPVPHQCREANSYSHLLLSIVPSPDQRGQAKEPPILEPHLSRVSGQQSYPAVFSQWPISSPPSSELKHLAHPKREPNSRIHLTKDINRRHIQKSELSWLMKNYLSQSKPAMSGRGDYSLKCADINVR